MARNELRLANRPPRTYAKQPEYPAGPPSASLSVPRLEEDETLPSAWSQWLHSIRGLYSSSSSSGASSSSPAGLSTHRRPPARQEQQQQEQQPQPQPQQQPPQQQQEELHDDKKSAKHHQHHRLPVRGTATWFHSSVPNADKTTRRKKSCHNDALRKSVSLQQSRQTGTSTRPTTTSSQETLDLPLAPTWALLATSPQQQKWERPAVALGAVLTTPPGSSSSGAAAANKSSSSPSSRASSLDRERVFGAATRRLPGSSSTHQRRSVCFFDLDDTLIPTEWVRRAYVIARTQLDEQADGGRRADGETDVLSKVRKLLDAINPHLEKSAITVLQEAQKVFGVVVLVTNARSMTWLKLVERLFPRFRDALRQLGIPVMRAAYNGADAARAFANVVDYFEHWSGLKQRQFARVVESVRSWRCSSSPAPPRSAESVKKLLTRGDEYSQLSDSTLSGVVAFQLHRSTTASSGEFPARDYSFSASSTASTAASSSRGDDEINSSSSCLGGSSCPIDVISIGDSEFELAAAKRLAAGAKGSVGQLGLVRCKAGLAPDAFGAQLTELRAALRWIQQHQAWWSSATSPSAVGLFQPSDRVTVELTSGDVGFATRTLGYAPHEAPATKRQTQEQDQ